MSNDLISIVMPVKNAALYLEECLDSILNQSFLNWELIAVNDHSDDHSWQILQRYQRLHQNIICLKNKGTGIIDALNTAYEKSNGHYISRMDADDIMPQQKLETLYNTLIEHGKGTVATGLVQYFSAHPLGKGYQQYEAWLNKLTSLQANYTELYKECVIPSPCWMIHREDFEQCGAFRSKFYPEDYDLCFRWYQHNIKCISSDKTLHLWRDSADRASRTSSNYADNSFLELKIHYFLRLHYSKSKKLVLWGAGKKGKRIAKLLVEHKIQFRWLCNNPKKIGHYIHQIMLESCSIVSQLIPCQIIVATAQPEAQLEIELLLKKEKLQKMQDYFFFC